jgi:hypothetical protein
MLFPLLAFTMALNFVLLYLKQVDIRIPTRDFRDFPLFTVGSPRTTCSSARSASAANCVCDDTDNIFSKQLVSPNYILK